MSDIFLFLNLVASIIVVSNLRNQANIFLGLVLFLNVLQGFTVSLFLGNYSDEVHALFFLNLAPLSFLIGPALFFYIQKKLNPAFKLKAIHLLHLLPMVFFFIVMTPYITSPFAEKIQTIKKIHENAQNIFNVKLLVGKSIHVYILRSLHVLTYVTFSLIHFAKNKANLKTFLSPFQTTIAVKWIRLLIYSIAIMHSCNLVNSLYLFLNNKKELNGPLPLSLLAAFALANISVRIFINPYILYGFNTIRYYSDDSILAKRYKKDVNSNDLFTEDWKYEIAAKVKSIELTKKFADQGYQLANMAVDLDIPKYQLNHYFKEFSQESFSEWKNRNRVLYAIELIKTGYLNTYTVETLSQVCGYKSRGNFNSAFLEVTGKRLSEYVKTC